MKDFPFVSVIIPVFNNSGGLFETLSGLECQNYPKERVEVFVIDNGSKDSPDKIAQQFNVNFLKESRRLNSPYSARNRGLELARGAIIIFLDTTSRPTRQWMLAGVREIESRGMDLVGGNVSFDVSHKSTLGEIYDSVSNIRMRELVETRGVAAGCNLFIKREVLNKVGFFEEGLRSGGDLRWTKKATEMGFRLSFSEGAKVVMTPKKFGDLLSKAVRVAKGHPRLWLEEGRFFTNFVKRVLFFWVPPNPFYLKRNIAQSSFPEANRYFFSLYLIRYMFRLISIFGFIQGGAALIGKKIKNVQIHN